MYIDDQMFKKNNKIENISSKLFVLAIRQHFEIKQSMNSISLDNQVSGSRKINDNLI